jgi:phage shock protein A
VRQSRSELEAQLTSQISEFQSQTETANQNQNQLQSQISELENQLESVRQSRSELEAQLETANTERSHFILKSRNSKVKPRQQTRIKLNFNLKSPS